LLIKFDKNCALKLSFLMSLPIVLAGNIVKNWRGLLEFSPELLVGVATAFVFGLATIHLLLKVAQKINFGLFVLLVGALTVLSTLL
ncbi:MAG: UDP-diphosphatase, partial [Candidatus Omnitrophica bacterium]|nr:UDP-diphosphatase [Candidatus Omnitrophota bacterium]